ncbi:MAG: hypothetical protein ACRDRO_14760 [Pseudonocardiaceae bacterium]
MRAYEHRAIGDAATGAALVNIGGESVEERFLLSFGDVVALSGDYFRPDGSPTSGLEYCNAAQPEVDGSGRLFSLACAPGQAGTRLDTRDEIICALKVTTVDEVFVDPRFEPRGQFGDFRFNPSAARSEVERRVRDRFLTLAASNDDHFVTPGRSDAATGSGFGSALVAYRNLHQVALDEAWHLGRQGGDVSRALAREAAAAHYLTDAFAAGHLRTPVASIRRFWKARYPSFWEHLQRRVASDTATALRELSRVMRLVPARFLYHCTLFELTTRTSRYPELSLGDLVARAFHDWDNTHGLAVDGGGIVFGDGHVDEGVTRELALAGVRAGIDDVEVAFGLGASGNALSGEALYAKVREATGAGGEAFLAETRIPRLSPANPGQNWEANDAETLWESPMVGSTGATVGQALAAMLEPGELFMRQLDGLGKGLSGERGVFAVPIFGRWLSEKGRQAYHRGFVESLTHDPQRVILALLQGPGGCPCHEPSSPLWRPALGHQQHPEHRSGAQ